MKQKVPFLPRLKMTRHLSTIVEVREDSEDFTSDGFPYGRSEYRHRRFGRRVFSCGDIQVVKERTKEQDPLILPPLTNPESGRKPLHENWKGLGAQSNGDRSFPDFRPQNMASRTLDLNLKAGRKLKREKSSERSFSQNKENIVDSWLKFFG